MNQRSKKPVYEKARLVDLNTPTVSGQCVDGTGYLLVCGPGPGDANNCADGGGYTP